MRTLVYRNLEGKIHQSHDERQGRGSMPTGGLLLTCESTADDWFCHNLRQTGTTIRTVVLLKHRHFEYQH